MPGKKAAILALVLAIFFGYRISNIYTPENFEGKGVWRFVYVVIRATGILSRAAADLGIGTEPGNFRLSASVSSFIFRHDENVTVKYDYIEGIRVKEYWPKYADLAPRPIAVFYHGGGFFMGNIETYDYYIFELVKRLNMTVVSVELAPEHPYPTPTEDCYKVTRHIIENSGKFSADLSRLVLIGDSSGGTVVAAVTQRFRKEKLHEPKIQVLIYPLTQFADPHLPSYLRYVSTGVTGASKISLEKFAQWYFGVLNQTDEIYTVYRGREHFALIDDPAERQHILSCLDTARIDHKYKQDNSYYGTAKLLATFPTQLPENSVLRHNKQLIEMFKWVFKPEVSPLFAKDSDLEGLPKAYFILLEWDFLKDESILYSSRLKRAGVDVHEMFYENAYHGMAASIEVKPFVVARKMLDDLIRYLELNL